MRKYKPTTHVHDESHFDICVTGTLWCGSKCSHVYQRRTAPKDAKHVKTLAGDFESIDTFTVAKITTRTMTTHLVLMTENG